MCTRYPKKPKTTSLPTHIQRTTPIIITHKKTEPGKNTVPKIKQHKMFGLQVKILLMGNWSKLSFHIKRMLNFFV